MNFLSTYTEGARRMWMDYEGYGMGWHWLGWLGMAFFWLVLVLLVLAAVKYLMGNRRSNAPDGERKPDALAILRKGMLGEKSIARSFSRNVTT